MNPAEKILAIDVGNSDTKIGCFINGQLEAQEHFSTEKDDAAIASDDALGLLPSAGAAQHLDGVIISSVVPAANPLLEKLLQGNRVFWVKRETLQQLALGGIDLSRYAPNELGTDRIANIVAAYTDFPEKNVLVCDFGTTTTFDLVDASGAYLGGAICPGPRKFQSLVDTHHAAQLFEVDLFQKPRSTPGKSTQDSLANGLYYGYKGAVLEIIGNLLQEAQWPLSQTTFLFTGGYARQIRDMLMTEIPTVHIDSGATLKGLYRLWTLNQARCLTL